MDNPITHLVPMLVTEDLDAIRRFYGGLPSCRIDIDMPHYVQIAFATKDVKPAPTLAFMASQATGPLQHSLRRFDGEGLVVSVPVPDADAHHRALTKADRAPLTEPTDKPWGWRSFLTKDPCGVALDFFHVKEEPASADAAS